MMRTSTWLFRIAARVSAILWLATAIAWPLSYWQAVSIRPVVNGRQPRMYVVNSGRIVAQNFFPGDVTSRIPIIEWMTPQPTSLFDFKSDVNHVQGLGFEWWWSLNTTAVSGDGKATDMKISFFMLAIPFWFLFIFFAWPVVPLIRRLRRGPPPGEFCDQCGYDLRATPDRCPECGAMPQQTLMQK